MARRIDGPDSTGPDALTSVDYWLEKQGGLNPGRGRAWVYERYAGHLLPRGPAHTCLEVGVVPGGNLLFLARMYGYRVTGVDFSPRVRDLGPAFAAEGIDARFVESDFFTWNPPDRFDVVCTFGFFQHFRDFRSVIARHWDLVKPGGLLLATVPALTPFQLLVRRATYRAAKFRSMLAAHNRRVMQLSVLRQEIERCAGAEILLAQYIREMTLWFDGRDPDMRPWAPAVLAAVDPLVRAARRFRWSSRWFSPEILVLARKKTQAIVTRGISPSAGTA